MIAMVILVLDDGFFDTGTMRLGESPFYSHNKSNVFERVSYNVIERVSYTTRDKRYNLNKYNIVVDTKKPSMRKKNCFS